jgi:hypothetical protein
MDKQLGLKLVPELLDMMARGVGTQLLYFSLYPHVRQVMVPSSRLMSSFSYRNSDSIAFAPSLTACLITTST